MIPHDVALEIRNPWGGSDELIAWEPDEDLTGPLVNVTARGLRIPAGHLSLRRAWTAHYDIVSTASGWLAGNLNLQDVDSLVELGVDEIIMALFSCRRWDVANRPVFYQN